jgi:hypothetical protein
MQTWSNLNHLQVGAYSEYFAKMSLVRAGFDVFSAEVDDKGIDFVIREDADVPAYYDVQVKSIRLEKSDYVFMTKDKFPLIPNRLLVLVLLSEGNEPEMFVFPATVWLNPAKPFVDYDYESKASKPEYGLRLSRKNLPAIEPYRFEGRLPA